MELWNYQTETNVKIYNAWGSGHRFVLAVMPTGGGKTVCFTKILAEHNGACIAIAHRQELVGQMSLTLGKQGILHNVIAPKNVIKEICRLHAEELGKCFFSPSARCYVAGVDTLVRRSSLVREICQQVTLWVIDEAHHVLRRNKWGKAVTMFPNAHGLGVTATPIRTDGMGLGRHADGVFDELVEGPNMRWMINNGYLTEYKIFAPETTIDFELVTTTPSGEFNQKKLVEQTTDSTIIGDIVEHYLKIAPGEPGASFLPSVNLSKNTADKFNAAGVPAISLDGTTPMKDRVEAIRRFKRREILQLCNVGLFNEGFDMPALKVVSMGSATQSFGKFSQEFGRMMRLYLEKTYGILIDHVGNVKRHGLPDAVRVWTLDRRDKKNNGKDNIIPTTTCIKCSYVRKRYVRKCPDCDYISVPTARSEPDQVDGDLIELDPSILAQMRGEIDQMDRPAKEVMEERLALGQSNLIAGAGAKQHRLKQEAQEQLRALMRAWGDDRRSIGWPDSESYRYFFLMMGVDVMTAQTLKRKEAEELIKRMGKLPWIHTEV